jgi:hypothetical protein
VLKGLRRVSRIVYWVRHPRRLLHLLLLLLFHHIGVNDCRSIELTDIIHTPSSKALDRICLSYYFHKDTKTPLERFPSVCRLP